MYCFVKPEPGARGRGGRPLGQPDGDVGAEGPGERGVDDWAGVKVGSERSVTDCAGRC